MTVGTWLSRLRADERMYAALLGLAFLALYGYTAAPSVLSGDSAEFQMAAPLLGVPHPTTYPLYILLGKLATVLVPLGDLAWRVTLLSSACAALAVALFFLLAARVTGSAGGALVGALALGLSPGLWNAATLAEVYALLAALLAGLGWLLASAGRARAAGTPPWRWLRAAALVGGLGCAHHGLFVLAGLPLLAFGLAAVLIGELRAGRTLRPLAWQLGLLALCFAAGLLPWLFPLAQYARYGPFAGEDYGLPQHYFWGAPESWAQVLDLLSGGPLRRGIFRVPAPGETAAVLGMVARRLLFEFGGLGLGLGLLGALLLPRRWPLAGAGAAWVLLATLGYLLLLGPAVQDAPVFTLPILLPWALWVAAGAEALLARRRWAGWLEARLRLPAWLPRPSALLLALLVAATLGWGYTRVPFSSKRGLWLFRQAGEAVLRQLPPGAVVLAPWERGMILQYLVLAERQRPDVWVDVVEPGNEGWGARADRRYPGRAVYLFGLPPDVEGLPVRLVEAGEFASLYQLRR